jgi:hypothetical protein
MPAASVSHNIFQKCLPAYGTDIKQCGTVTVCDVQTVNEEQLAEVFMANGNYRVLDALLLHDFEIKTCQTIQNGLYDFIMANKVDMSNKLTKVNIGTGRYMIMPFIQAMQKSRINNEYWRVTAGNTSGIAGDEQWHVSVVSTTDMPGDVRWFNTKMRVYIDGVSAGGSATRTAWRVNRATATGATVDLYLISENTGSFLGTTKAPVTSGAWPTAGLLVRGTPNVNDYEEWCEEGPGLNLNKLVPFWIETVRHSLCTSSLYEQYREMIIDNNAYYKKFADVPEVEKNAQLGADWQRRVVNTFWGNKALENQDLTNWRSLETITTHSQDNLDLPGEGVCVGYKANAIGVYEQLAQCGRVRDLQNQVLNLPELFRALYEISRLRESNNQPSDSIDAFTDSEYAAKIQQAMIRYFKNKSEDTMHMNVDITKAPTNTKFGFRYNSYVLDWPPITFNVVSHKYFDDKIAAARLINATHEAANRFLWIIDWSGIYPGIIASDRVVNKTGDLATRAQVDASYMCVMKVPTQTQTLTSMTWTIVVECPASSLILENISSTIPEHAAVSADAIIDYYGESA